MVSLSIRCHQASRDEWNAQSQGDGWYAGRCLSGGASDKQIADSSSSRGQEQRTESASSRQQQPEDRVSYNPL